MSHNFACLLCSTCTRSQPTAVWRMHNNLLTRQGSDQLGPAKATLLLLYNHFIVLYHWGVTVETIVKKLQLPNQCLILCTLGNSASDPRLPSATNFWPMIIRNSSSRFLCISLVPKWIRFNTEWLALSKSKYILGLKTLTWDAFSQELGMATSTGYAGRGRLPALAVDVAIP